MDRDDEIESLADRCERDGDPLTAGVLRTLLDARSSGDLPVLAMKCRQYHAILGRRRARRAASN